jgi:hypothetical protein
VKVTKPAPATGMGVDIAPGGVAADVSGSYAVGDTVELDLGGTAVAGTVRMARALDGGKTRIGVQFAQEQSALFAQAKG